MDGGLARHRVRSVEGRGGVETLSALDHGWRMASGFFEQAWIIADLGSSDLARGRGVVAWFLWWCIVQYFGYKFQAPSSGVDVSCHTGRP